MGVKEILLTAWSPPGYHLCVVLPQKRARKRSVTPCERNQRKQRRGTLHRTIPGVEQKTCRHINNTCRYGNHGRSFDSVYRECRMFQLATPDNGTEDVQSRIWINGVISLHDTTFVRSIIRLIKLNQSYTGHTYIPYKKDVTLSFPSLQFTKFLLSTFFSHIKLTSHSPVCKVNMSATSFMQTRVCCGCSDLKTRCHE